MCIIAYKNSPYSDWWEKSINTMAEDNPDGNGVAIVEGNSVWWEKGISLARVHALSRLHTQIILHFRIATSGGVNNEMCHPFLISSTRGGKQTPLKGHLHRGELLFFHNGIFRGLGGLGQSDTCEVASMLSPMSHFIANKPENVIQTVEKLGGNSKYIIIGKSRRHIRIATGGQWLTDNGNDTFSNSSYKRIPRVKPLEKETWREIYPGYTKYKVENGRLVKIDKLRY